MKRSTIIYSVLLAGIVLSACANQAQVTPEVSAEDIQFTAVAAAFTIVAETQAAIPTNTPLPPTETPSPTPLPTETAVPSPTLDPLVIPTATTAPQTSNGNTDPCNQLLPSNIQGLPTKIRIYNHTNFNKVKVSLYLGKTVFGECGFAYVPVLGKNARETLSLVEGTYYIYAWTDDGKLNVSGSGTINNPDLWEFEISESGIRLNSP